MEKLSLVVMFMLLFTACDKGHKYSETKQFIVPQEEKDKKFKEEIEKQKMEICEVEDEPRPGFFNRLGTDVVGIFIKKEPQYDLIYPQTLTQSVLMELTDYYTEKIVNKEEFAAEEFWLALSIETKAEINNYLIKKFSFLSVENFSQLRNIVAFSFLFYLQEEERMPGYEIYFDDPEIKIEKMTIAYTKIAEFEKRKKIRLCGDDKRLAVKFIEDQDEFIDPSEVTASVICEKKKNKVQIEEYNNDQVTVTFTTSRFVKELKLLKSNLEVNTSSMRKTTLNYSMGGDLLQMEVKRKTKDGKLLKVLSLKAIIDDGVEIKMNDKMNCKSVKPFALPLK